ncbi:MAG: stage III sporulation protein AB [Clostridia bacterium]|nr:stage III sporulation protein AB [Clostridia bacterium]
MTNEIMRLSGGLLIVLCGALSGILKCRSFKARAELMGEYLRFLTQVEAAVGYTAESITSILAGVRGFELLSPVLKSTLDLMKNGRSFESAWCSSVKRCLHDREDRQLMYSFGSSFGTDNVQGELSKLALHRQNAETHYAGLTAELKTKSRLYRTLGVFCGVMAAAVLL